MARRRSRTSSRTSSDRYERRKSDAEARVERITWALLVLVFAIVQLLPAGSTIPNFFVPFAGAIILLGSGLYQYSRHWRVSPVTWIGGAFMALFTYYDLQINPATEFHWRVPDRLLRGHHLWPDHRRNLSAKRGPSLTIWHSNSTTLDISLQMSDFIRMKLCILNDKD